MAEARSPIRNHLCALLIGCVFTGCSTLLPTSPGPSVPSSASSAPNVPLSCPQPLSVDAPSVAKNNKALHSLKRQLHEQKKRIAELETQLDALKVIDHSAAKSKSFNVPSQSAAEFVAPLKRSGNILLQEGFHSGTSLDRGTDFP
jgi:hypothetical protein